MPTVSGLQRLAIKVLSKNEKIPKILHYHACFKQNLTGPTFFNFSLICSMSICCKDNSLIADCDFSLAILKWLRIYSSYVFKYKQRSRLTVFICKPSCKHLTCWGVFGAAFFPSSFFPPVFGVAGCCWSKLHEHVPQQLMKFKIKTNCFCLRLKATAH